MPAQYVMCLLVLEVLWCNWMAARCHCTASRQRYRPSPRGIAGGGEGSVGRTLRDTDYEAQGPSFHRSHGGRQPSRCPQSHCRPIGSATTPDGALRIEWTDGP